MPTDGEIAAKYYKGIVNASEKGLGKSQFWNELGDTDYNPDKITIKTYKKMLEDAQVYSARQVRVLAAISKGVDVAYHGDDESLGDEMKRYIRKAFVNVNRDIFQNGGMYFVIQQLLFNGGSYGYSVAETVFGDYDSLGDGYVYPRKIKVLPIETLRNCFSIDDYGNLEEVIQNVNCLNTVEFKEIQDLYRLIIYTHNKAFSNWYGRSDLKVNYKNWFIKDYLIKFWNIMLERYGAPFLLGKVSNPSHIGDMDKALNSARTKTNISIWKNDEVEIIESAAAQREAFLNAIKYHDQQIMIGQVVPTLLMGIEETGARNLGEVHFRVFLWNVRNDQKEIADVLNLQIRKWIDLNFDNVDAYPHLTFPHIANEDLTALSDAFYKIVTAGIIAPDEKWIREALNIPSNDILESTGGLFRSQKWNIKMDGFSMRETVNEPDYGISIDDFNEYIEQEKDPRKRYNVFKKMQSSMIRKNDVNSSRKDHYMQHTNPHEIEIFQDVQEKKTRKLMEEYLYEQKNLILADPDNYERSIGKRSPVDNLNDEFSELLTNENKMFTNLTIDFEDRVFEEMGLYVNTKFSHDALDEHIKDLSRQTFKGSVDDVAFKAKERVLQGLAAGERPRDIASAVSEIYANYSIHMLNTVVRTITNDVFNASKLELYKQNSDFVNGVRYDSILDQRTTTFCEFHDGMTYKLDNPDVDYIRPPNHFQCFIDHQVPIYTEKGWKKIKDIEIGDMVLTHKGRFRKVNHVHHKQSPLSYDGDVCYIYFDVSVSKNKRRFHITVTPNHPILTSKGWVNASDLNEGDEVITMASRCNKCGKIIPWIKFPNSSEPPKYCSGSCRKSAISIEMWKNEDIRKSISKKASEQMYREYENGTRDPFAITANARKKMIEMSANGTHPFQRADVRERANKARRESPKFIKAVTIDRMGDKNVSKRPEVRKKMSDAKIKQYRDNPETHPNRIMGKRVMKGHEGYISIGQRKLFENVKVEFESVELEFPVKTEDHIFFIDVAIPNKKIGFEYDGSYWHQDKEKDIMRDKELQDMGWSIIRYRDSVPDVSQINSDVNRVIANHEGKYEFTTVKISKIERKKLKRARRLYNFSVTDDESYIAKGVVTHNCRSMFTPITILDGPFKEDYQTGDEYPAPRFGQDHFIEKYGEIT